MDRYTIHPDQEARKGALQRVADDTSAATGIEFFKALVLSLNSVLPFQYAFVGELMGTDPMVLRSLATAHGRQLIPNSTYPVLKTPSELILKGKPAFVSHDMWKVFPESPDAVKAGIESILGVPLLDEAGKAIGVLMVLHDKPVESFEEPLSVLQTFAPRAAAEMARLHREEAIRKNEQRLRILLEQAPAIVWTTDTDLRITSSAGAALKSIGETAELHIGQTLHEVLGDDVEYPPLKMSMLALTGVSTTYENFHLGRVFQAHIEPLRGHDGGVIGTVGVALDISDRKRTELELQDAHDHLNQRVLERTAELEQANASLRESELRARAAVDFNRRLLMEIDHRVRNNVSAILALISLMRHGAKDVAEFADAVEARLLAMAHIHQLLSDAAWGDIDLALLATSLFKATRQMARFPNPVAVEGPPALVTPQQALPLAMVLVELFTNSCKYGAHSTKEGSVRLAWSIAEEAGRRWVKMRWTEQGGPTLRGAVTPSLGMELIEQFVGREMLGRSQLGFPATGADHAIEFPVAGQ